MSTHVESEEHVSTASHCDDLDRHLIDACVNGEATAWETLYRRYYQLVRRTVAWPRWQLSSSEVEECVQDVFLELLRALPLYRGEASLSTFLARLAKNRCISLIRRKTAQKRAREEVGYSLEERKGDSDEPTAIAVSDDPLPDQQLCSRESASEVLGAVATLKMDCQKVLYLRYYCERSYEEICTILSLPLGTVCSRLKRCLERLRKVLESS